MKIMKSQIKLNEKVTAEVQTASFANAMVSALVREFPQDEDFLHLHDRVQLGEEPVEARQAVERLEKENSAVNTAMRAIELAFAMTPEETKQLVAALQVRGLRLD